MSISSRLLMVTASWWVLAFVTLAPKATSNFVALLKEVGLCAHDKEKWLHKLMPSRLKVEACYYDDFDEDDTVCFADEKVRACRMEECPTGYNIKMERCTTAHINTFFEEREGDTGEWNVFDDDESSDDEDDDTDLDSIRTSSRYKQIHECSAELERHYLPQAAVLDGELCYDDTGITCFLLLGRHITCRVTTRMCPPYDPPITKKLQCTTKMLADAIRRDKVVQLCVDDDLNYLQAGFTRCRDKHQFCVLVYAFDPKDILTRCRFLEPCPPDVIYCDAMDPVYRPCSSNPCTEKAKCVESGRGPKGTYRCKCPKSSQDPNNDCQTCTFPRWGKDCRETCGACSYTNAVKFSKIEKKATTGTCDLRKGCSKCRKGVSKPPHCNKVDCKKAKCRHNGVCQKGKCLCTPKYTGVLCDAELSIYKEDSPWECDEDEEVVMACIGIRSECYVVDDVPMCECEEGRAGDRCQFLCLNGSETCLYGSCFGDKCKCDVGYTGKYCQNACKEGYFNDCKTRCGHCLLFCDHVTGRCRKSKQGTYCSGPYVPPMCVDYDERDTSRTAFKGRFRLLSRFLRAIRVPSFARNLKSRLTNFVRRLRTSGRSSKVAGVQSSVLEETTLRRRHVDSVQALEKPARKIHQRSHTAGQEELRRRTNKKKADLDKHYIFLSDTWKLSRRRRQGNNSEPDDPGQVEVDFLVLVPKIRVSGAGFADQLAEDMKQNADDFDRSGQFTVDKNSIQLTQVSPITDDPGGTNHTLAVGVLLLLIGTACGVMMLLVVRQCRKKSQPPPCQVAKNREDYPPPWPRLHTTSSWFRSHTHQQLHSLAHRVDI